MRWKGSRYRGDGGGDWCGLLPGAGVARYELTTSGAPVRLLLVPDPKDLDADGQDLPYAELP